MGRTRCVWIACGALIAAACRQAALPPLTAQVSGTLAVAGLSAPVRIDRDRWGVPHVFAASRDDAFFAQGFVQAEDRLFQMELWRRSAQGRLAEVLGANFIERDAMTRRLQYRGDMNAEWARYGPDTRQIAEAFARGVNAWVALSRERPPELFAAAGWPVAFWSAEDLLNRTDAFDRAGTIAAAEQQRLPAAVVAAVRRAAVPAFFTGLARPPRSALPPGALAPTPVDTSVEQPDVDIYPNPSARYLIHLRTPGWNAAGAAVPWRPGIATGHDGVTTFDKRDVPVRAVVRAVPMSGSSSRVVDDVIAVKGRAEPFIAHTEITPTGVVVATDRAGGMQFTLTWRGHDVGTAPAFARGEHDQLRRPTDAAPSTARSAIFAHPLAITNAARARFNIGPLTPASSSAPPVQVIPDPQDWDRSRALNAPGQSEDPGSPHHADLAALWAGGQMLTLAFTEPAVTAHAVTTLTLVPDRRH